MKHQTPPDAKPWDASRSQPWQWKQWRRRFEAWSLKALWCLVFEVWCLAIPAVHAQAWLDRVDDALFLQSRNGQYRVDLSGLFDLEGYYIDQRLSLIHISEPTRLLS